MRSKSWSEFATPDAPAMDFVITVCDTAAGEVCPVWPGQPVSAHWGVEDPSRASSDASDKDKAFRDAFIQLHRRISILLSLPLDKLDHLALKKELDQIGQS